MRLTGAETDALHARITCPTLLVRGMESWASDPVKDGRAQHFQNARLVNIGKAALGTTISSTSFARM